MPFLEIHSFAPSFNLRRATRLPKTHVWGPLHLFHEPLTNQNNKTYSFFKFQVTSQKVHLVIYYMLAQNLQKNSKNVDIMYLETIPMT